MMTKNALSKFSMAVLSQAELIKVIRFWVLALSLMLLFFPHSSLADKRMSRAKCVALMSELDLMLKAQTSVKKTLVTNHETFASTLEEYSDQVSGVSTRGSNNPLVAAKNMKSSAQSFRSRGHQSQQLSRELDEASLSLLKQVKVCLNQVK